MLAQQIDALPQTIALEPLYDQLVERGRLRPDLDRAVRELLNRSKRTENVLRRLANAPWGTYFQWQGSPAAKRMGVLVK